MVGLFARLKKPVDFESIDDQPVDLIFLLLAPDPAGAAHLKALARVSRGGVVGEMADEVIVMYVGKIVEKASTKELFDNPLHPYTRALFRSLPKIGDRQRLKSIPGSVPSPYQLPRGCSFQGRCEEMLDECREKAPPPCHVDGDHLVYCWRYYKRFESNR